MPLVSVHLHLTHLRVISEDGVSDQIGLWPRRWGIVLAVDDVEGFSPLWAVPPLGRCFCVVKEV